MRQAEDKDAQTILLISNPARAAMRPVDRPPKDFQSGWKQLTEVGSQQFPQI